MSVRQQQLHTTVLNTLHMSAKYIYIRAFVVLYAWHIEILMPIGIQWPTYYN